MKYCNKCGKQIADDAAFCMWCGAPVVEIEQNNQNTVKSIVFGNSNSDSNERSVFFGESETDYDNSPVYGVLSKVWKNIRQVGSSPLMLIYLVMFGLSMIISVAAGLTSNGTFKEILGYDLRGTAGVLAGIYLVIILIFMIPSILSWIGLTLFHFDCKAHVRPEGKGLGLFNAGKVISIIYASIGGVALLVLFISILFMMPSMNWVLDEMMYEMNIDSYTFYAVMSYVRVILFVLFVILIIILILGIIYYVKVLSGSNDIKDILKTGNVTRKLPIYPAVYQIVMCAFSLLGVAGSFSNPLEYFGYSPVLSLAARFNMLLSRLNVFIGLAASVLQIILLFMIRNAVNSEIE